METIRVLLADDHRLFRAGVRALLQGVPGVDVVGEAGDGHEALALVASQRPHVLLMDISMPGMTGLEAARRVAEHFPDVRVGLLSMHATEQYVGQALSAGAAGYLLKDSAPIELETAIRAVARGENYLSPAVSGHLVKAYRLRTEPLPNPLEGLTPRQCEVLRLIGEGKTTKEIAQTLGIRVRTAETHRLHLMKRLDLHNVAALVRFAARVGLVNLEDPRPGQRPST